MANTGNLPAPGEAIRDHLLPPNKILAESRRRLMPHVFETIAKGKVEEYEEAGWVVHEELKYRTRMRKGKTHDRVFEDRVWATFARLEFDHLNRDRSFNLTYGPAPNQKQQIDVFAADDEVILLIECKSTETIRAGQFKREIEAISGQREGIIKRVQKEYPGHKSSSSSRRTITRCRRRSPTESEKRASFTFRRTRSTTTSVSRITSERRRSTSFSAPCSPGPRSRTLSRRWRQSGVRWAGIRTTRLRSSPLACLKCRGAARVEGR